MPIPKALSSANEEDLNWAQVNDSLQEIDNKFRVNVIKDETGVPRIIFGKLPDGTYGLVISEEGVDVLTLF